MDNTREEAPSKTSTSWRTISCSYQLRTKRFPCRQKSRFRPSCRSWEERAERSEENVALKPCPPNNANKTPAQQQKLAGLNTPKNLHHPDSVCGSIPQLIDMDTPSKRTRDFAKTIRALEKRRKSRIFCVVHTGGAPHICHPEINRMLKHRDHFTGVETLEILIHSPGGHADKAYRLARYFRSHCERLNVLIPMLAKSAATLLCLNADTIFMGEFAEVGPLDAQLRDEVEKGQEFFSPLDEFKAVEFLREYSSDIWITLVSFWNTGVSVRNRPYTKRCRAQSG